LLNDAAKELIKNKAELDIDYYAIATFLHESAEEHINSVIKRIDDEMPCHYGLDGKISENNRDVLKELSESIGKPELYRILCVTVYANSGNFYIADSAFNKYISPNLDEFTADELELLLKKVDLNNQAYWRGRARYDHRKVLRRCMEVLGEEYKYDGIENWDIEKQFAAIKKEDEQLDDEPPF